MRNTDIFKMSPGVLYTNTSTDTQSPTDAAGLDSLMSLSVLVLQGRLVEFPYMQDAEMGRVKSVKRFGRTPFVAMY